MLDPLYVNDISRFFKEGFQIESWSNINTPALYNIGCFKLLNIKGQKAICNGLLQGIKDIKIFEHFVTNEYYLVYTKDHVYANENYMITAIITYIDAFEKLGFIPPMFLFFTLVAYGKVPERLLLLAAKTVVAYRKYLIEKTNSFIKTTGIESNLSLILSESTLNGDNVAEAALHDLEEENA